MQLRLVFFVCLSNVVSLKLPYGVKNLSTVALDALMPTNNISNYVQMFAQASFYIELRRPLSAGIENNMHHLHINEIEAWDSNFNKCQLLYIDASRLMKLGYLSSYTPEAAIDGDYDTYNHNDFSSPSDYGTEDHWMEFACMCNSISKIRIYNRRDDCCSNKRILHSVLTLMGSNKEVVSQHTITTVGAGARFTIDWDVNYKASFYIELRRPLTAGIHDGLHNLAINEIEAWDGNKKCQLMYIDASRLMQLGHSSSQTPEAAVDGYYNTGNHNDFSSPSDYGTEDHWMEFACMCNSISRIRIYNRGGCCQGRIFNSVLTLKNSNKKAASQHTITTVGTGDLFIIDWDFNIRDFVVPEDDKVYFITNKHYYHARLTMFGTGVRDFGTFERAVYPEQLWVLQEDRVEKGWFYIKNLKYDGYRLIKWGPKHDDTGIHGGNYYQDQLWKFVLAGEGFYYIYNKVHSAHRLRKWGSDERTVHSFDGGKEDNQLWFFTPRFEAKISMITLWQNDNRQGSKDFPEKKTFTRGLTLTNSMEFSISTSLTSSLGAALEGFGEVSTQMTTEISTTMSTGSVQDWSEEREITFIAPAGKNYRVLQPKSDFISMIHSDDCTFIGSYVIEETTEDF